MWIKLNRASKQQIDHNLLEKKNTHIYKQAIRIFYLLMLRCQWYAHDIGNTFP